MVLHLEAARLQPGDRRVEARRRHAKLLLVLVRVKELPIDRARRIVFGGQIRCLAEGLPPCSPTPMLINLCRIGGSQRGEHRDAVEHVVPQHYRGIGDGDRQLRVMRLAARECRQTVARRMQTSRDWSGRSSRRIRALGLRSRAGVKSAAPRTPRIRQRSRGICHDSQLGGLSRCAR